MQDPRTKLQILAEDPDTEIWTVSQAQRIYELAARDLKNVFGMDMANVLQSLLASHERLRSRLIDALDELNAEEPIDPN